MYFLIITYRDGRPPSGFEYPTKEHAAQVALSLLSEDVEECHLYGNRLNDNYGTLEYIGKLDQRLNIFVKESWWGYDW